MIAEFKVMMSNFSAENQKGPAVISSVAKSGGKDFHGSGFIYARNYALNANDGLFNANGQSRPENKYYYPGLHPRRPGPDSRHEFNKNRNKLFFFTGFEYFYQVLDTGLLRATVPTAGMLNGNFSPAELSKLGNITASGGPPGQIKDTGAVSRAASSRRALIDKNMQALMKLYPLPNADPNATGGYNYVQAQTFNQNNTSGCRAWTTASATTPSCSSATTCSAKRSCSRGPLVAQRRAGSVSDAGSGQEPVRFRFRVADPRVQPDDDQRIRLRLHLHRLPNVFEDPSQGGPHEGRLQL